jgi:hypothetical protein
MPVEVWRHLCCQIILRHRSTKPKKKKKTVSHKQQKSVYNRPDLLQPLASFRIKRLPRERHMHAHENSQERDKREKRQRLRKAQILPIQAQTLTLILAETR